MNTTDRTSPPVQILVMLFLLTGQSTLCFAQFNPLFPNGSRKEPDPVNHHLLRLPHNRLASTFSFEGKKAIEKGDISDGLESLQSLLDESSDFFEKSGLEITGSARQAAEEIIAEHQIDYERLYGDEATQIYERALASKDLDQLAEVTRRFRLTQAGQRASQQLSLLNLDRGEIETAARLLISDAKFASSLNSPTKNVATNVQRAATLLALTGNSLLAKSLLNEFQDQLNATTEALLAGLPKERFSTEAEAEIFDWVTPHGSVSHTGQSSFAPAMFSDAWSQPLIDKYDFFLGDLPKEKELLKLAQSLAGSVESKVLSQRDRVAFPAGRPLIVGERVIVSGYATTKLFNLKTGEIDGVGVNVDQSFEYLQEFSTAPSLRNDKFLEDVRKLYFSLRGWRDLCSTSMSTDGKYVYAIADSQLVGTVAPMYLSRTTQRHELLPQPFNQLRAFELEAGLRNRWSIGTVVENATLPFTQNEDLRREIYFYGAPLPVADQLFIIGEERGQIQLYELDRETGSIIWSIGLLNPDEQVTLDEARRVSGIMPSYIDGLLICPTGEGVITAINPLSRKVVWSHQYEETRRMVMNQMMFRRGMRSRGQTIRQSIQRLLSDDRWFDAKVLSAGNYIIHTPPDSNELVCLNISDGTRVWKEPKFRLRSLHVAGVFNETLIIVGSGEVAAISLKDASRVWSVPIPKPSGRGVRMKDHYLQPLMTGEIAFIDLKTGRQIARTPLPGQRVIGNLAVAHGRLIAQSGTEIVAFKSLTEIETMMVELTDENEKKLIEGELLIQQGNRIAGMQALESVSDTALSPRGRRVLAWAKLDGLQRDYDAYQPELSRIEKLLATDEQRFIFLQAKAAGLRKSGDLLGAFQSYLELFETRSGKHSLRNINGLHEVSDQRWALAQFEDIYSSLGSNEQGQFDNAVSNWLKTSTKDEAVTDFLKVFPLRHLDVNVVFERLSKIEVSPENASSISTLFGMLSDNENRDIAATSFRELARASLQFKDGASADSYLKLLSEFAATPKGSQSQASEVATSIRANEEWSEQLNAVPVWPTNVQESEHPSQMTKSSRHQIPMIGPSSIPLQGWTFFLNPMGSHIDIYDQHGRRRSQVSTGLVSSRYSIGSTLARYVSVRGHLAMVVLADRFLLIDFQQSQENPHLILNKNLITEAQNPYGTTGVVGPNQNPTPGFRTFRSLTPIRTPAGNVGAIGAATLCYGLGTQLTAVDPGNGKVLWRRYDLAAGSEIFSDDEFVLTLAHGESTLHLYRASDGTKIGTRSVPDGAIKSNLLRENGDWNRHFPVINKTETTFQFSLYDPVTEKIVWHFDTPLGTLWTSVERSDIAFLAPDHTLTIVDGLTGQQRLQKIIPVDGEVESFTVLARPEQWIILPGKGLPQQFVFSYPSLITRTIEKTVDGTILAIDRKTGEVEWTRAIEDQKTITQSPTAWPILFFGNNSTKGLRGVILNRLSGTEIINREWEVNRRWIHWQASIQPLKIRIGYGQKTIDLDCIEPLTKKDADEVQ